MFEFVILLGSSDNQMEHILEDRAGLKYVSSLRASSAMIHKKSVSKV